MIGRLVQHQQLVISQKDGGESRSPTLTPAQRAHRCVQIDSAKQMLDHRSGARFRRPGVVGASADDHVTHRVLRCDVVVLVQIADRQRSSLHDTACIRLGPAAEDAQQRALPVTVTPDHSDDVTAPQAEAYSGQ